MTVKPYTTPSALRRWSFNFNLKKPNQQLTLRDTTGFTPVELQLQPKTHQELTRIDSTGFRSVQFHFNLPTAKIAHMNPHFTALEAAYQLHYYLWFKTHYLQPLLKGDALLLAKSVLNDVCARQQYHLLDSDITTSHMRLLVSLQPHQAVSQVVKMLKGNLQHKLRKNLSTDKLLGGGYFARTSGKIDLVRARQYVESQITHHGYEGSWIKPLKYRNDAFKSPAFSFEHNATILNYHLVFATQNRIGVFDEAIAPGLFEFIVSVGKQHKFEVDRIGLLPDHMHMIIEGVPAVCVEQYALAILNDTRDWMEKNYRGVLKNTGAWNVWQQSFYGGSIGEYTTAQVKSFLSRG